MRRRVTATPAVLMVVTSLAVLGSCNLLLGGLNHLHIACVASERLSPGSTSVWSGDGEALGCRLVSPSATIANGTYEFSSSGASFTVYGGSVTVRHVLGGGSAFEFDLMGRNNDTWYLSRIADAVPERYTPWWKPPDGRREVPGDRPGRRVV